jgi:hypothetical protein
MVGSACDMKKCKSSTVSGIVNWAVHSLVFVNWSWCELLFRLISTWALQTWPNTFIIISLSHPSIHPLLPSKIYRYAQKPCVGWKKEKESTFNLADDLKPPSLPGVGSQKMSREQNFLHPPSPISNQISLRPSEQQKFLYLFTIEFPSL